MSVTYLSDVRENAPHTVGPTWRVRLDGKFDLPEFTLGWGIIDWMATYLKHPEGDEDEPFLPTFEQARFLLWWYAVDEFGKYAYRAGCLRRMKGWGKDPLIAAMSLAELAGPVAFSHWNSVTGEPIGKQRPQAWIQLAAVSQEQTQNTFLMFPALMTELFKRTYKVDDNKTIIYARNGCLIQAVTSSPKAMEGKRPTFVVMNETQWWVEANTGHEMYKKINGNVGKGVGRGARFLAICNAHIPGEDSIGERMWEAYKAVAAGTAVDTKFLYDSLEAPANTPVGEIPSEEKDPIGFEQGVEQLIAGLKVARGDSVWLDVEGLVDTILDVQNEVSESRRMFLNQVNAAEDSWMTTSEWSSIWVEGATLEAGDVITLGFDGSKGNDTTALVACRVSDGLLKVLKVWNPKDYKGEIPREEVNAAVEFAFSRFKVVAFRADVREFESYIDAWATEFRKTLKIKASPNNWVAFDMRTQVKKFALDCEKFLDAVREGEICHGGDKILELHILNAHRHPTKFDAISIRKASKDSSRKIDAAVAAVLAFGARQEFLMSGKNRTGGVVVI